MPVDRRLAPDMPPITYVHLYRFWPRTLLDLSYYKLNSAKASGVVGDHRESRSECDVLFIECRPRLCPGGAFDQDGICPEGQRPCRAQ